MLEGLDPVTGKYNATLLEAKKDPAKTMSAIRTSAKALDALIRQGILKDEWDAPSKEMCKYFLRGKCKLGDKCTRSDKPANGGNGKPNGNQSTRNKVC